MQVYRIDKDGFYIEPVILSPEYVEVKEKIELIEEPEGTEEIEDSPTLSRPSVEIVTEGEEQFYVYFKEQYTIPDDCVSVAPPSFYKPKWVTNKWVEAGTQPVTPEAPPTVDEKVESLEQQVADLMFMMMTGGN